MINGYEIVVHLSPKILVMKHTLKLFIPLLLLSIFTWSCNDSKTDTSATPKIDSTAPAVVDAYDTSFAVNAESFADLQMLRYQVPGFNNLSLQQKQLAYYLYEAAMCGRDIIYDQHSKYGLTLRKTLETGYGSFKGDTSSADWKKFVTIFTLKNNLI